MNPKNKGNPFGLSQSITRRDFINTTLIGSGVALVGMNAPGLMESAYATTQSALNIGPEWTGPGGIGDYAKSNGNTHEVVNAAHAVWDGRYYKNPDKVEDTGEVFDVIIVGAGFAGISAAHAFIDNRNAGQSCLVLDNHPVFGGEAKRNELVVNGRYLYAPQGSNVYVRPEHGSAAEKIEKKVGVPESFDYAEHEVNGIKFDVGNYQFQWWGQNSVSIGLFFDEASHGVKPTWVKNPWKNGWEGTPYSTKVRKDITTFFKYSERPYKGKNFRQWLDAMTYQNYIEMVMGLDHEVTRYTDDLLAAAIGGDCASVSAYAAHLLTMPGLNGYLDSLEHTGAGVSDEDTNVPMWDCFPGGNTGLARYYLKGVLPAAIDGGFNLEDIIFKPINFAELDRKDKPIRMRLSATVVRVEHEGTPENSEIVKVMYNKDGHLYQARARGVVMAGGGWMNRRVVHDMPIEMTSAYQKFVYSPVLVVNMALTNWRFMDKLGISAFRYFSGLGFCANIRRPMYIGDQRPTVDPNEPAMLTFYMPMYGEGKNATEKMANGRWKMFGTSYSQYERQLCQQMTHQFAEMGFNAERDIGGIILNRWGHGYIVPGPGFYYPSDGSQSASDRIRQGYGRIRFGAAELMGFQNHSPAANEGYRAGEQVMNIL